MLIEMHTEVRKFLSTCKSPRTADSYSHVLRRLVDWLSVRNLSFQNLTPSMFKEFVKNQPWKAVSQYFAYNVTRSFLRWKFGEDHPLKDLRMKRPKAKPQITITQEQFNVLLEYFNTMTPIGARDLALFALISETGLRASEVCNLQMMDLHLDALQLIALDKGGEWKVCKFSPLVASYLTAWLAHRSGIAKPDTTTVFCSVSRKKKGLPPNRFGLLSRCREISRKVGFKFTPHVFRRFMATRSLELGASDTATMKQGGWKSTEEFKKYVRTYQVQDITPFSPVMDYFKKKG